MSSHVLLKSDIKGSPTISLRLIINSLQCSLDQLLWWCKVKPIDISWVNKKVLSVWFCWWMKLIIVEDSLETALSRCVVVELKGIGHCKEWDLGLACSDDLFSRTSDYLCILEGLKRIVIVDINWGYRHCRSCKNNWGKQYKFCNVHFIMII